MPLIPPMLRPVMHLLERTGVLYVQSRYDRTLKFGRGVSTDRMIDELGFTPEFTTREAAEQFAAWIRTRRYHEGSDLQVDRELLDYVQRKMHQMPSLDTSLFGRLAPRFDPDRVVGGDEDPFDSPRTAAASAAATAMRTRADAGLDDEDHDDESGHDEDLLD